jgi:hypothetical protein
VLASPADEGRTSVYGTPTRHNFKSAFSICVTFGAEIDRLFGLLDLIGIRASVSTP